MPPAAQNCWASGGAILARCGPLGMLLPQMLPVVAILSVGMLLEHALPPLQQLHPLNCTACLSRQQATYPMYWKNFKIHISSLA